MAAAREALVQPSREGRRGRSRVHVLPVLRLCHDVLEEALQRGVEGAEVGAGEDEVELGKGDAASVRLERKRARMILWREIWKKYVSACCDVRRP